MGTPADASVAADEGLRREAFYFPSGGDSLYGSLYSSLEPGLGVVVCPSWGWELGDTLDACHRLARGVALLGGAGLVLHWPGHGDSTGDPTASTLTRMEEAARDALAQLQDRASPARLGLAGVRLGASVVTLLGGSAQVLLLLQPAFDPDRFFETLHRASRAAEKGGARWAFGQAVPDAAPGIDVLETLNRFTGRGAVFAYRGGEEAAPAALEWMVVPGNWRRHDGHAALADAALTWLRGRGEGA